MTKVITRKERIVYSTFIMLLLTEGSVFAADPAAAQPDGTTPQVLEVAA